MLEPRERHGDGIDRLALDLGIVRFHPGHRAEREERIAAIERASQQREKFDTALAKLESQGAEIVEISAPHFEYGVAAYYLILPAEASSNLAKFDSVRFGLRVPVAGGTVEDVMAATREAGFGDEVKRRIILGTYALSAGYYDAYYGSAQKVRTLIQQDFAAAFANVDVIATPTAPTTAARPAPIVALVVAVTLASLVWLFVT